MNNYECLFRNKRKGKVDAGLALIKWLRNNDWNTPILIYCEDMMKILSWHASYSNVLVASTQTQMDIFFQSMTQNLIEEKKEKKEKDSKEEMKDSNEEKGQSKIREESDALTTKKTG